MKTIVEKKICPVCGKEFILDHGMAKNQKYCSKECQKTAMRAKAREYQKQARAREKIAKAQPKPVPPHDCRITRRIGTDELGCTVYIEERR